MFYLFIFVQIKCVEMVSWNIAFMLLLQYLRHSVSRFLEAQAILIRIIFDDITLRVNITLFAFAFKLCVYFCHTICFINIPLWYLWSVVFHINLFWILFLDYGEKIDYGGYQCLLLVGRTEIFSYRISQSPAASIQTNNLWSVFIAVDLLR